MDNNGDLYVSDTDKDEIQQWKRGETNGTIIADCGTAIVMSLPYIGQQIAIYSGFFLVTTGMVGNGINILVFSSVHSYRTTPCTFYFLIASIYNIIFIAINLTSRIVTTGYGIDLTRTSISWCKMRLFFGTTTSLISLTCSCLATTDQFFATSQSAALRRCSNIKWSQRIVLIVTIVWFLHGIPYFVFYNISPITNSCVNTNYAYAIYYSIYLLGLSCVIPVLIMIVFGYLAYRNIHLTRVLAEQRADRQLMRMILLEVVLVVISVGPYGVNTTYSLITSSVSKDVNRLLNESFSAAVLTILFYTYFAGNCYMFLISSSRFRQAAKGQLFFFLRLNQVTPTQMRTVETTALGKRTRN